MLAENKGTQKKNLHEAMNQSTFKPSVESTALFPFNQSWKTTSSIVQFQKFHLLEKR